MKTVYYFGSVETTDSVRESQRKDLVKISTRYPKSVVEPDGSLTIRQMYDNWVKGKPTTVHPYDCEYDEKDSDDDRDYLHDFDEPPHDIVEVEEAALHSRQIYEDDYQRVLENRRKKAKESKKAPASKDASAPKDAPAT